MLHNILASALKELSPKVVTALGALALGGALPSAHALITEQEIGLGTKIGDGGGDVYDFFGEFRVNGENYNAGVLSNIGDSRFTFFTESVGGAQVTAQVRAFEPLGTSGGRTDYRFVRWWYQISNPSFTTQQYTVTWGGDLGSDDLTTIRESASVAGTGAPFRWIITEPSVLSSPDDDPTLATLFASAAGAVPPGDTTVTGFSSPNVLATYSVRVAPRSSVSLVFFASARVVGGSGRDGRGRLADAQADLKSTLLDANGNVRPTYLAEGLTSVSRALNHSAANFDQFPTTVFLTAGRPSVRRGRISLAGTAYAALGIREVRVQVGKSRLKARGTTVWSFSGRVRKKGSTLVTVQAFDSRGVGSTPAKFRVRVR